MAIKYGRGKFEAHENYIDYMKKIVEHENYHGMPNAVDDNGRINWQVSSGKGTSFYKYYQERFDWWVKKADSLNLEGTGNSNDRFTIAARLINPSGKRPCRLCGNERYVGYMYINHLCAHRWNKNIEEDLFKKGMNIIDVSEIMIKYIGQEKFIQVIKIMFPERSDFFHLLPEIDNFFINSQHIKSKWLSPGFMGNPPDRLDGFHDYGICCRKRSDPGRSDENMRTYNHDRRAFKWWAEGDWIVADALYNSAGSGTCAICEKEVKKVSPDHVGPLSCGFKQLPFFIPLCTECNASKNRRFTKEDTLYLISYENETNDSVASWQIRKLWDLTKDRITSDEQAKELSNYMRGVQDYYLRFLNVLKKNKLSLMLSYYLTPKNAYATVHFDNLNRSLLTYSSYTKKYIKTKSRRSLAARIVRIAFEELEIYSTKDENDRKLKAINHKEFRHELKAIVDIAHELEQRIPEMKIWNTVINDQSMTTEERENKIQALIEHPNYEQLQVHFTELDQLVKQHFDNIGEKISESI